MKSFNFWNLCLAIMLSTGYLSCAQSQSDIVLKEDEQSISFTTDRFTLPNLHVTPDKKQIIFDVLGDIYQVPIEGGNAEVLLQDAYWKRGAKLSPDGKTLAYISDRAGEFQVWTYDLETHKRKKYPIMESYHYPLSMYWNGNDKILIPNKEGLNSFDIHTGKRSVIRRAKEEERSTMHYINRNIYVGSNMKFAYLQKQGQIWKYNINTGEELAIAKIPAQIIFGFFKIHPNDKSALYYRHLGKDNLKNELVLWDMETGALKVLDTISESKNSFINLDYSFDFIDDHSIVLDKEGEIVQMDLKTGDYKPIPIEVEVRKVIKKPLYRAPQYIRDSIITASVLRNPVTQPTLDTIYFGAFGKLHSYVKTTGEIQEVYPDKNRFEVSPSLSPDGKYLAYTTWNDWEMGHLYVREILTGKESQLTNTPGRYINPAWSPDGTEIVFIADETEAKLGIERQGFGPNTHTYYLDIHRLVAFYGNKPRIEVNSSKIKRITLFTNKPRRFYPIPIYHPNGKSIFIADRDKEKSFPVLEQISLDAKTKIDQQLIPFHTDEVVISPNAKHIAYIFDQQVWVDQFPSNIKFEFYEDSEFMPKSIQYEGGVVNNIFLPDAKSVYEVAPSYLYWQDEHTLMWGSAEEIYTYDVRTQKTQKIADIKVQKPRAVPQTQYALTHARIITVNKKDEIIEEGTILVKNNRIKAVGKTSEINIPDSYKIFDMAGKTIMPGLIDVHSHIHKGPYEFKNQQEHQYISMLAYGVTTIYDPHSNALDYREQAQMVEVGDLLGPRVLSSGNIIYFDRTYASFYKLGTLEDAIRMGKSLVKLKISGPMKDYELKNPLIKRRLRKAASIHNLGITTHQEELPGIMNSVLLGYTGIEHDIRLPVQKDILIFIAKSGVGFTPTYVVTPGIGNTYYKETDENKIRKFNSEILFEALYKKYYGKAYDSALVKYNENIFEDYQKSIERLKVLFENNVAISVGGHGDPLPGIGTHWEIWFMRKVMGNYQAIRAATINGAKKLDLQDEIGSLEEGKLADLIILNNNPLSDIFYSTDILYTIKNGVIYNAENMKQEYPLVNRLDPWGWLNPAIIESMENIYSKRTL